MTSETVADEEILWRRIPPDPPHFKPPDQIGSINFKLRSREDGLSLYRASKTTREAVLNAPGTIPGSFLVEATAGEIRRLCGTLGQPLRLIVEADDPDGSNPGHALVLAPANARWTEGTSKSLRNLFRRVDEPA